MAKKTFILSDESVNSYGFRVLTGGIDLSMFEKNPIMLWSHVRSWSDRKDAILPIGKWENIRIEKGVLKADAVFDEEDAFAASISRKVEKGMINMCSIGFEVLEESELPEHVLPGQRRRTVTHCRLREASVTDLGSNYNAISLYDSSGKVVMLSEGGECPIGLLTDNLNDNKNKKEFSMKLIALSLGLAQDAPEASIVAEIEKLKKLKDELVEKDKTIGTLQAAALAAEKKSVKDMVAAAVLDKKITADKVAHFESLGEKVGVEVLKSTLDSISPAVKPSSFIGASGGTGGGSEKKKFSELSSEELVALRSQDVGAYRALYKEEFGFEPEMS